MDLHIHLCSGSSCGISIEDRTEEANNGYLPEMSNAFALGRYKYEDTASICVLQHNKSEGPVLKTPLYFEHLLHRSPMEVPIDFDGWFTVWYIVLPTKDWLDSELEDDPTFFQTLDMDIYFIDGEAVYKYRNGLITSVELEEVVARNEFGSNISKTSKDYVSICFLKKCYVSLCQQLFNRGFNPCFKKDSNKDAETYKRDLVWMAINVISYMTQFEQLAEAQRIIERLGGCNGVCGQTTPTSYKSVSGCGCGKRV